MTSKLRVFNAERTPARELPGLDRPAVIAFRAVQRCSAEAFDPDMWGFGWSPTSKGIYILATPKVHRPCGSTSMVFEIDSATGAVLQRFTEEDARRRFGRILPPLGRRSPQTRAGAPTLTGKVTAQRSCRGDGEAFTEFLTVKASLHNRSDRPLVIYRGSRQFAEVRVARDAGALRQGTLKEEFEPDFSFAGTARLSSRDFVTVAPGSTTEIEGTFMSPVPASLDRPVPGMAGRWARVMTFTWVTWPFGDADTARWRKGYGADVLFWTVPIVSEPIAIRIPERPKLMDCGG